MPNGVGSSRPLNPRALLRQTRTPTCRCTCAGSASAAPRTPAALLEVDGERFTSEFAGTSRDKEIVAPPERKPQEDFATEIRIIRHGITQGYSTDAGLTPMGGWQSHQRGHSLSKSVRPGQKVRIVCADTSRARQTADQIYRGMTDGLRQWGTGGRHRRARADS